MADWVSASSSLLDNVPVGVTGLGFLRFDLPSDVVSEAGGSSKEGSGAGMAFSGGFVIVTDLVWNLESFELLPTDEEGSLGTGDWRGLVEPGSGSGASS